MQATVTLWLETEKSDSRRCISDSLVWQYFRFRESCFREISPASGFRLPRSNIGGKSVSHGLRAGESPVEACVDDFSHVRRRSLRTCWVKVKHFDHHLLLAGEELS